MKICYNCGMKVSRKKIRDLKKAILKEVMEVSKQMETPKINIECEFDYCAECIRKMYPKDMVQLQVKIGESKL